MLTVGGMTSCSDILDKEVDLTYTDENIYSNYDRTRGVLANAYSYLPDAFADIPMVSSVLLLVTV